MGKYFGTDGIRGKVNETMNAKLAFKVGQSLKEALQLNQVVIGYDTRESSPTLAYMVASGALSQGLDVLFLGICSTPMLAYYAKKNQIIGVMITASHNPYTDNGIKIFNKGDKLNAPEESMIESYIDSVFTDIVSFGSFRILSHYDQTYLKLYEQFKIDTQLKIAFDTANGGNYLITKTLLEKLNLDAIQIGDQPNGLNINKDTGSTHIANLQHYIKDHQLDLGFSFDGDGDRVIACDKNRIYDGDQLIYIISTYLKKKGLLKNNKVVLTKMANPGIIKAFNNQGIDVLLTDVGDKHVFQTLDLNDAIIGGENSGHIILRHLLHTGDGLLASMYILQIISEEHKDLKALTKDLTIYPYQTLNLKDINRAVLNLDITKNYLNDLKESLGEDSLLLVRPSGTEPVIRITISTKDQNIVNQIGQDIIEFLIEREKEL